MSDVVTATASLPHSPEAEKAVIGAILANPDNLTLIEGVLRPEHFFMDAHRRIYLAMLELSARNDPTDLITVSTHLEQASKDRDTISGSYLLDLLEKCPVAQNIEHYARIVRNHFYTRRIILACQTTVRSALNYGGTIQEFVEDIEKEFLSITSEYDRKGIIKADKVLEATIEDIQAKLRSDGSITGVPTGFTDVDAVTGGLQGSDLIILAARPGMGKTALALNIGTHAALKGKSVVIFSLEMSKEQLMGRVLSTLARVDSSRLRKGELSNDDLDRLMEAARRIYDCKERLGIDETPGINILELRSRCRRFHKEFGLDLVIIDYLQLMGPAGTKRYESREREISEISMGLKNLAKELRIPVLALSQLNRGPDSRPDKKPKISDLRESGSMEQDADMVWFVYRDEYYNPASELAGIAELIFGKNRHGPLPTIQLAYQPNFVAFQNLSKEGLK